MMGSLQHVRQRMEWADGRGHGQAATAERAGGRGEGAASVAADTNNGSGSDFISERIDRH